MNIQDIALGTFTDIIANAEINTLLKYIRSNTRLMMLPGTKKYIGMITVFKGIPLIGGYLAKAKSLSHQQVLAFMKEKNPAVFEAISKEKNGLNWFIKQFNDFMNLL